MIHKFPFSEIAVLGNCESTDNNQCLDSQAECKNDNGYKCICKDTYYLKGNKCEHRNFI